MVSPDVVVELIGFLGFGFNSLIAICPYALLLKKDIKKLLFPCPTKGAWMPPSTSTMPKPQSRTR